MKLFEKENINKLDLIYYKINKIKQELFTPKSNHYYNGIIINLKIKYHSLVVVSNYIYIIEMKLKF